MHSYSRRISHALRPDTASNSSWDQKPSAEPTRKSPEPEPDEEMELVEFEIWHVRLLVSFMTVVTMLP